MQPEIHVVEKPEPIVSIEKAREHLAELPQEDEAYVKGLILAATTWIDGPTGWLGRALGVQTLELSMPDFYACADGQINLPFAPVLEIVSVRYRDGGVWTDIPENERDFDRNGIYPVSGSWPSVSGRGDNVTIRYKVGCARRDTETADYVTDVPESICFAILLLVAHWYKNREAVVIGAAVTNLPFAVEALLQPYRVYR